MEDLKIIRIVDVIDILLVTALVTMAVIWVRRTQAVRVAAGLILLAGLYIFARIMGLSLLSGLFEGSLALFVLIAVVIFQKELRRFFEGFAAWGLSRRDSRGGEYNPGDLLVECLTSFARQRIGALVVLPGEEPIESYAEGGIELNGKLSRPLLYSIFDPSSPGHDGAVIVKGDRVTRFSVHLPLSGNFGRLGERGTRHSAALGLSEQTDALCLVVSEERGSIMAAKDGKLHRIDGSADLKKTIQDFVIPGKIVAKQRVWLLRPLENHWIEVLASMFLVIGIWWVMVAGSVPVEKMYQLPVQVVGLPTHLILSNVEPDSATITFRGPRRIFQLSLSSSFGITIDTALAHLGRRTFAIRNQDVKYPEELELVEIRPTKVRITVLKEKGGPSR